MLNPKLAEERLKEFTTEQPEEKMKERVFLLPKELQVTAFGLLKRKPDGELFLSENRYDSKLWEAQQKAVDAAFLHLDRMTLAERQLILATFFPQVGSLLAHWWKPDGKTL